MTKRRPLEGYRNDLLALRDKYSPLVAMAGGCDRQAAEQAVRDVYAVLELKPPVMLWYASPYEAAKAGVLLELMNATLAAQPEEGVVSSHAVARAIHSSTPGILMRKMHNQITRNNYQAINSDGLPYSILTEVRNVIDTEPLRNRHDTMIFDHVARLLQRDNPPDVRPDDRFTWLRACKEMLEQVSPGISQGAPPAPQPDGTHALAHLAQFAELFFSLNESEQHWLIRVCRAQTRQDARALFGFPASILSKFECGSGDAHYGFDLEVKALLGMERCPELEAYLHTLHVCGWWQPHEEFCIMVDRPVEMHLDDHRGLHRVNGPAVRYADDYEIFAFRNVEVSREVAYGEFNATDIDNQRNIEIRRVMIDVYGAARYLQESGAVEVQRDECGVLYHKDMPNDERLVMVKVVNSTPEPDGTFKEYYLRVPPNITTARGAVAWTFGFREADYQPAKQT